MKTALIWRIDRSQPSKHVAFRSLQILHINQCSTNLQLDIFWCQLNFPFHEANNSITLCNIAQWIPNKQMTIVTTHKLYASEEENDLLIPRSSYHIQHQSRTTICLFRRLSVVRSLPKEANQDPSIFIWAHKWRDQRDYGWSCSPRNYPKLDLGSF